MNSKQAYSIGIDSGIESARYGDFTATELSSKEAFLSACGECCDNKRQYADHPGYDFGRERNSENLWDAFERGENRGALLGWRERRKSK